MSIYLNAALMLGVTVAAFVLLARLLQKARAWRDGLPVAAAPQRLAIEQVCVVDAKRRLVLVKCDGANLLLLTGGPGDLMLRLEGSGQ